MNILFCGDLEALRQLVSLLYRTSTHSPINLLGKGPMSSSMISTTTTLNEQETTKILTNLNKEGLLESVEKGESKVYFPKYILELEKFDEFNDLSKKIGSQFKDILDRLLDENKELIIKVCEDKKGEYSLGSLIAHLTLQGLNHFLEEIREELREDAEVIAETLIEK